jgi:hypothetical protein
MIAHEVQFIGGPLDGHTHLFTHAPEQLPSLATLAISPDVIRVVTGAQRKVFSSPTSTAVYCLDQDGDTSRYYHVASIAVQEHQLDKA